MSRPTCGVCGDVDSAGSCPPHHFHSAGGADPHNSFPFLHDQASGMQPPGGGLQEFQFFGHNDHESVAWLFDDDPPPAISGRPSSQQADSHHSQFLHQNPQTFDPFGRQDHSGHGLTFEVSLSRGDHHVDAGLGLGSGGARHKEPAASATIMSFCGSTFTDAASSRLRQPVLIDGQLRRPLDPAMERKAKVMRYREKRNRRCYEKQIRYVSRKAYAEVRPRVRGRFAKVPEGVAPQQPTYYDPSRLDLGRWFRS